MHTEHRKLTARTDYTEPQLHVKREGDRVLLRLGNATYCRESELDRYVSIREEKGHPARGMFITEVVITAIGLTSLATCPAEQAPDCSFNKALGLPLLVGGAIATVVDATDFRTKREEQVLSETSKHKRKQLCGFEASPGREITLITEDGQRGQIITNLEGEASARVPAESDVDVLVDGKPQRHLPGLKPQPPELPPAPSSAPPPDESAPDESAPDESAPDESGAETTAPDLGTSAP